jgi:hypothetical protein
MITGTTSGRRCVRFFRNRRSSSRTRSRVSPESWCLAHQTAGLLGQGARAVGVDEPAHDDLGRCTHAAGRFLDHDHRHDDTVVREVAPVAHDDLVDLLGAAPVDQRASRRNASVEVALVVVEQQGLAVLDQVHALGRHAGLDCQARMLHEHAVLAVHGDEMARPQEAQHLGQIRAATVSGDVHARRAAVHDLTAAAVEMVEDARDGALAARDHACGVDQYVALADLHVAMLGEGDQRQRGERLALAARDQEDGLPGWQRRGGLRREDVARPQLE